MPPKRRADGAAASSGWRCSVRPAKSSAACPWTIARRASPSPSIRAASPQPRNVQLRPSASSAGASQSRLGSWASRPSIAATFAGAETRATVHERGSVGAASLVEGVEEEADHGHSSRAPRCSRRGRGGACRRRDRRRRRSAARPRAPRSRLLPSALQMHPGWGTRRSIAGGSCTRRRRRRRSPRRGARPRGCESAPAWRADPAWARRARGWRCARPPASRAPSRGAPSGDRARCGSRRPCSPRRRSRPRDRWPARRRRGARPALRRARLALGDVEHPARGIGPGSPWPRVRARDLEREIPVPVARSSTVAPSLAARSSAATVRLRQP